MLQLPGLLFPTVAPSRVPAAASGVTSATSGSDVDQGSKEGVQPEQTAPGNHAVDLATHAFRKPEKGLSLPEHISTWEKSEVSNWVLIHWKKQSSGMTDYKSEAVPPAEFCTLYCCSY